MRYRIAAQIGRLSLANFSCSALRGHEGDVLPRIVRMLAGGGDARPIEPLTAEASLLPSMPGAGHAPTLPTTSIFGVVGHVVHIGPVEREGGFAAGEDATHVFFQIFLRVRTLRPVSIEFDHIGEGIDAAAILNAGLPSASRNAPPWAAISVV